MRKFIIGCVLGIFALIILCLSPIWISVLNNELRTRPFANLLFNYPLPPQTQVTERRTEYFIPINGGTCDFSVYQVMRTRLSRQQIEAYYKNVYFLPLRWIDSLPEEYNRAEVYLTFESQLPGESELRFTAQIGQPFFQGGLDPRCYH